LSRTIPPTRKPDRAKNNVTPPHNKLNDSEAKFAEALPDKKKINAQVMPKHYHENCKTTNTIKRFVMAFLIGHGLSWRTPNLF